VSDDYADLMQRHDQEQARADAMLACIDEAKETECRGPVEYRPSLTGTGTAIERCDGHWGERLRFEDELRRVYPDSPNPPDWFDPADAGERWDDDY